MTPLENAFFLTLPLREFLEQHLDIESYVCLLCSSWTLYMSHQRVGILATKQLHLTPLFVAKRLLRTSVGEAELRAYLQTRYNNITQNGDTMTLLSADARKMICIYLHAPGTFTMKVYTRDDPAAIFAPCVTQYQNTSLRMANELEIHAESIDWIVLWLRTNFCFEDNCLSEYYNADLQRFAFQRRWNLYCNDIHQQYLAQNNLGWQQLYDTFYAACT